MDESFPTTLVYPAFRHTWGIFRVTESLVALFLGDRGRIDDPQGVAVARLKERDDPAMNRDDDEVTLYAANAGAGDILYNPSMSALAAFGGTEDARAGLLRPRGIAADDDGHVFVADAGHARLVHLLCRGGRLTFVAAFGPPLFSEPFGVALDRSKNAYTTDRARNRVVITSYDGHPSGTLDAPAPTGIAVNDSTDPWSCFKARAVYVVCRDSAEIWRFDGRGQITARVRAADLPGRPRSRFVYLAIDYCDNIYATDPATHAVHKFDRNLVYLTTFGRPGTGDAQFISPRGIAIHRRFGQVFVVEQGGAQYYWVGADLRFLVATFDPGRGEVQVTLFPTERAFVRVGIYSRGRLIRTLVMRWTTEPGPEQIPWDLTDDQGRRVGAGTYAVRVEIEPTYSSYTHFKKKFERTVEIR
ncbi:MAG: hypothetical protein EXS64_20555 [Candidatus Latescibacteria bacterium]|nr:hypothetical protein [Candidatus Latescibacterota bacterium]